MVLFSSEMDFGRGVTITMHDAVSPLSVWAVIVARPSLMPVTTPPVTFATLSLEELHVMVA